jgi:hypothetical protein
VSHICLICLSHIYICVCAEPALKLNELMWLLFSKKNAPTIVLVDGSRSMEHIVVGSFYRQLSQWVQQGGNPNVLMCLFGSDGENDNHIGELRGLKTPREFETLSENYGITQFARVSTSAHDIEEALKTLKYSHPGVKFNVVIVGDGEFNDDQYDKNNNLCYGDEKLIQTFQTYAGVVSTLHILVVPFSRAQATSDALSKSFAAGLDGTSVTVSVKPFNLDALHATLETTSMPTPPAGFSQPVFGGKCWLAFNNDKLLATPAEQLRASLRGAHPEQQQQLVEALAHAALGLTHAGQVNRLRNNMSLQNVWRLTKEMNSVMGTSQLNEVMNQVTTAGSRIPELRDLMRSSTDTNVNTDFNKQLIDFVGDEKLTCPFLVISPELLVDPVPMQQSVPTNVELAATVRAFAQARTVASTEVFSKSANSSASQAAETKVNDADIEKKYVPLLSLDDLPAERTDVATQQTIVDYVSVLLSAVVGMMDKRISGFLLLRWVLLLLSAGDQGPLQVDKNPTWKILSKVFRYYVEHAHGVNLQPAKMSESIRNMLGHKTTFALFAFGCKTFPTMAPKEFSELLRQVALGQTLSSMVHFKNIRKYIAAPLDSEDGSEDDPEDDSEDDPESKSDADSGPVSSSSSGSADVVRRQKARKAGNSRFDGPRVNPVPLPKRRNRRRRPKIGWKQLERVKAWLQGDKLKAAFRQFQSESHDVGTPVSGFGVRQWLAQGLDDEKDRKLFLFYLNVLGDDEVEVDMETKTDDEKVALSSKECGFCGMWSDDVKKHVTDVVPSTTCKYFKAFIPSLHSKTNVAGSFSCVACKEEFSNRSQRTKHLKSTTGECRRGQTKVMWEAHLVSVRNFVAALWQLTEELIESEAQNHQATLTLEMIQSIHSQPTEYVSGEDLVSQAAVLQLLGDEVAQIVKTRGKLTVFDVCSIMKEKKEAEAVQHPEAGSPSSSSSSQPQQQEQKESEAAASSGGDDEKKDEAVELDSSYLQEVLAKAKRTTTQRLASHLNSLKSFNECFVCMEEVAGASPLPCGHTLCGPCLHSFCQVLIHSAHV